MDNNACLYPNEGTEGLQNKSPLMENTPENKTYQCQNDIYCQFKPPENIPINSNNFPYEQDIVKDNNIDYETFQINSEISKYHIKQPNPNTFHISTGEKWLPLILLAIAIILIISYVLVMSGVIKVDGNGIIGIFFAPCIAFYLICVCIGKCLKYYNAYIIMMDNSLIIKSRSCVCRSTKTYHPDQINGISIYSYNDINDDNEKKYKMDILLSNNNHQTLMVLPGSLTDEEINYFLKVVNNYIRNKMKN